MDVSTLIIIFFAVGIIGMFWYSQSKLKNKLLCTFRRANKTKVEKLVPLRSRYVVFDRGRYNVNPKRITLFWFNRGIHQFFPTWLPALDFRWDSPNALDPETFENTWDTPESREMAENEDDYKAFNKGIQSQLSKKGRFPDWLLPMIAIGISLVVGYLVYQQGEHLTYLEQLIKVNSP